MAHSSRDERVLQMGKAIDAIGPVVPPSIDTLAQFLQNSAIAHNRRMMNVKACKRPHGKVVTTVRMEDTGKIVLVTEERDGRLLRVLVPTG